MKMHISCWCWVCLRTRSLMFVNIPLNASIKGRGCLGKFFRKRVDNPRATCLWQRPNWPARFPWGPALQGPCHWGHVTGATPPPTTPPPPQLVECSLPSVVLFHPSLLRPQGRRGGEQEPQDWRSWAPVSLTHCPHGSSLEAKEFLLVTDFCFGVAFWSLHTFFMAAASFSHQGSL